MEVKNSWFYSPFFFLTEVISVSAPGVGLYFSCCRRKLIFRSSDPPQPEPFLSFMPRQKVEPPLFVVQSVPIFNTLDNGPT